MVQRIELSTGFRPRCWQYHWNGDNQLTRLITPEGKQWFYQYDPLGRRVMKWHSSHQQLKIHYLWFGDQLVGIRDELNEEHTHTRYWHYDGWDLLAQQFIESDDNELTKVRTDWAVNDPTALPLRFYNQTGQLTWQTPKRTLWGKAYAANDELGLNELRFAGQQYDEESGLCYNHFRYYHPDSGCYLSPDPLGLLGGLNTHAYVPNPTGWVDPLGLAGCSLCNDVINDANKVASPGGHITSTQARTLRENLPVVQRRNAFQNSIARKEFVRDQKYLMEQWERNTGRVWPTGATPHHIIPLESGGANKWWNLMPTNGALPNHSLPGIAGPHAAGGVLRTTIQQGRKALPPGSITDLRLPYV